MFFHKTNPLLTFSSNKKVFFVFCFLVSVLGADKLNLFILGVHLKLVFLFLFASFILRAFNGKIKIGLFEFCWFLLFILGELFSIVNSSHPEISFFYLIWSVFNFLCVYSLFKSYSAQYGFLFVRDAYILSFRIQIFAAILLYPFFSSYDGRISLYYYEPSYFAIASIPYLCFVFSDFFERHAKIKSIDLFFIFALLFLTKSATLMFILLLLFILFFIFSKRAILNKLLLIFFVILSFSVFLYLFHLFFPDNLVNKTIDELIGSENPLSYFLLRSGNRWPRIELTWYVLKDNFIYGVGSGNFKYFTEDINFPQNIFNGFSWLNPVGLPAVNIFLEVLVECGLLGFFGLLGFVFNVFKISFKARLIPGCFCLFIGVLVFCISLCFESNYLRLYFWGFLGCVVGIISYEKKSNI